jgi:SAM domain (Sterile alpha motif)
MTGIAEWLASIGLAEYAQRFGENGIDLSVVSDLTEQDLKKFLTIVNLKAAKAVGVEVPTTLLARADEVIE